MCFYSLICLCYSLLLSLLTGDGCIQCPPGWILRNSMCYYFAFSKIDGLKSWPKAREFCQSHGGDLAIIDTKDKEVNDQHANIFLCNPVFESFFFGGGINLFIFPLCQNATVTHLLGKLDPEVRQGFWMGLKNTNVKGIWKWLNGKTLVEG